MSPVPGEQLTPRVVAIIQARMGSSRLPGKILADLAGRPMLWRVVNRVRMARTVHQVVVATTVSPADDQVAAYCLAEGIDCFRGSEGDVLDRYYQAARQHQSDVVIRITADCPFIDPGVIDRIVTAYLAGDCDYATNVIRYTYPHGLDTEVFSFSALETTWREAHQPSEREHVTPYIRNSGRFRLHNVENETDLSGLELRWTVDEPSDLAFARACYERLGERQETFGFMDLLHLLEQDPLLREINRAVLGHEGYFKSLAADDPVPVSHPAPVAPERKAGPLAVSEAAFWWQSAAGCRVRDLAGNEYIDTGMAGGTAILGYAHPAVRDAVRRVEGAGAPSYALALQVAELLLHAVPGAELVCLTASGLSAGVEAERAARLYTGREYVVRCTAGRPSGSAVGADRLAAVVNERAGRVAAIVVEPFGGEREVGLLLKEARALADQQGAILILDERRTMFRLAPGGAASYFGAQADLAYVGESMANGYPLGAVVGRRELVQLAVEGAASDGLLATSLAGEGAAPDGLLAASLAAATATLAQVCRHEVSAQIRNHGQKWRDGLNVLAREFGLEGRVRAEGLTSYSVVSFYDRQGAPDRALADRFAQECALRGVAFTGAQCVSTAHTHGDAERVLRVYRSALQVLSPISLDDYPR